MKNLLLIVLCFAFAKAYSQQPSSQPGNLIKDFGKTFAVPEPDFKTDTEAQFYIVFDVVSEQLNSFVAISVTSLVPESWKMN